ncbi:MAG TPA: Gfo/Idh/MocA family oxidoreductase [Planctomycetota bacterium]|jgi:predicted dehydrogenase|nr:Gfo/Idh/MocA family oxidoreductase [Planctomycetota bacterium]
MSPEIRPLAAAVVGLGVGEQHARAFLSSGASRLRWLFDLDSGKAQRMARELGADGVARSFQEILDDPSTDVVSIASYDDAHADQVAAALRARKHVFVEKPLCRNAGELRSILQAWSEGGRPHLVSNLVLREARLYRWLRDRIRAGQFGRLYSFDGEYLYGRLAKITEGWRKEVSDYSVFLGGGIHLADLMLELTGETPSSVFAVGNRLCTEGTAFRYSDYVAATYRFASGLIGRITANFGCVHRHQHIVRLFGTEATFVYDDEGPRIHRLRDPGGAPERPILAALPDSKGVLIPEFLRAVIEGQPSGPGAAREFRLMRTCFAADRSLEIRAEVPIDSA